MIASSYERRGRTRVCILMDNKIINLTATPAPSYSLSSALSLSCKLISRLPDVPQKKEKQEDYTQTPFCRAFSLLLNAIGKENRKTTISTAR